jgi:hypothetical protein
MGSHLSISRATRLRTRTIKFPRGAHDDLIDSLAYIDYIAYAPQKEREFEKQPGPQHPDYERWYIQQLRKKGKEDE